MAEHFQNAEQVAAYEKMIDAALALVEAGLEFARMPGVTDIREKDDPETATMFQALASCFPALANAAHHKGVPPHMIIAATASGTAQLCHQTSNVGQAVDDFANAFTDGLNQLAVMDAEILRAQGGSPH